jgi:hypothetical protein
MRSGGSGFGTLPPIPFLGLISKYGKRQSCKVLQTVSTKFANYARQVLNISASPKILARSIAAPTDE